MNTSKTEFNPTFEHQRADCATCTNKILNDTLQHCSEYKVEPAFHCQKHTQQIQKPLYYPLKHT